MSFSIGFGYFSKSAISPNWVGFTNMLHTVISDLVTLASTKEACPAWSAPIVGTNPIVTFGLSVRIEFR